jgi:hypothetical protein
VAFRPIISGRIIRVIENSGNENCYPKLLPDISQKITLPGISGTHNSGSGISNLPKFTENDKLHKISAEIQQKIHQ